MTSLAAASYGGYLLLFIGLGVPVMPWVNAAETALCLLALRLLSGGHARPAKLVMALVVLGHTVPATAILGWAANFHLFAFLFLVFALLDPDTSLRDKVGLAAAVTLAYLLLGEVPHEVLVPAQTVTFFRVFNVVMFASTLSALALIYASATWSATEQLQTKNTAERHARESLRAIFANAPVALVLSQLSDGMLLDANERATTLFDAPLERFRGRPALDFWVDPADRARLREVVAEKGRISGFHVELKTANGRRFWAELAASVVQIDGTTALLVGCADVTLRRRSTEALRRRENIVRTLLDAAPTPLVVTRLEDGVLQFANGPAAEMLEVPIDQLFGHQGQPYAFTSSTDQQNLLDGLRRDGRVDGFSAQLRTSSGRAFWALLSARLFDLEGDPAMIVGIAEVSAQKALEEQLRTLATTDGLTGVFNRRHFLELAEHELIRAAREARPTAVAMLDLDSFKAINDRFGHQAGDAVLVDLAKILRQTLRAGDVVGRVGGEEFALLLPETNAAAAEATLERLRGAVERHEFPIDGHGQRVVTVSIGLATARTTDRISEVIRRADEALYGAKAAGRNRVVVDATTAPTPIAAPEATDFPS
jgi:diguanylate cyclase (GGDEF)-like protein/PAS domain S-box-containing protein